jgi:type 1 glutamine amidotransferase
LDGFEFRRSFNGKITRQSQGFSALVIYIHHKRISQSALTSWIVFVSDGGGILAIHSATASFKKQTFFEILGGRFIGHGAWKI